MIWRPSPFEIKYSSLLNTTDVQERPSFGSHFLEESSPDQAKLFHTDTGCTSSNHTTKNGSRKSLVQRARIGRKEREVEFHEWAISMTDTRTVNAFLQTKMDLRYQFWCIRQFREMKLAAPVVLATQFVWCWREFADFHAICTELSFHKADFRQSRGIGSSCVIQECTGYWNGLPARDRATIASEKQTALSLIVDAFCRAQNKIKLNEPTISWLVIYCKRLASRERWCWKA
jgi:hypothetical protein